jgi:phosphate transport system ATP-binding protein
MTSNDSHPALPPFRPETGSVNGNGHAAPTTFERAHVVQLVSGDALADDAVVSALHRATVSVTSGMIKATDGTLDWEWAVDELEAVIHGGAAGWTLFVVPGIADFGVDVAERDVEQFRAALANLPGVRDKIHVRPPQMLRPLTPPPRIVSEWAPVTVETVRNDGADDRSDPVEAPDPVDVNTELAMMLDAGALLGAGSDSRDAPGGAPDDPTTEPPFAAGGPDSGATMVAVRSEPSVERRRGGILRRHELTSMSELSSAAAGSVAVLDARDISAWFGTHQVLDRVSLSMPAGKVTALIGPSGCGKSTFLRILNRMHEMIPAASMAGEVKLDGHDVYDASRKLTDARREIGMVFQKPNPFPAMSIYDNVIASFRVTGIKASSALKDEVVESCLAKAGLWNEVKDRLRQPGGGLSGGQQQRLCIARALAIKPRVLLMDEPCSALDPTSTRRIEQTIMELASELTIVIVTHNMQQAARVSDRCAFFLAEQGTPGVIVEHGPTALMFGEPKDPRTNDYVNGRFG